jgi:putative ubiquitin-RnfH superfamily antitoxin RatB of RatAB toxin-antitoxin module
MRVEVAYAAGPDRQAVIAVEVPDGATVGDAIRASGILARFPEIDLARQAVGVFGRAATLEAPISEGDRVEIYRPLLADPKEARRARERARKTRR